MTFGITVQGHSSDPEVEAKVRTLTEQFYNGLKVTGCTATFSSYGGAGSISDSWPLPTPPAPEPAPEPTPEPVEDPPVTE